jgi:dephospho-CoA kinase
MIKVGLTGGIGTGKSFVAKIFATLGVPIYNADQAAKYLMNHNPNLIKAIKKHFGNNSYVNNNLQTSYLAEKVFNNQENLALLNSLVHPVVIEDGNIWMQQQTTAYAIKEAAILFESSTYTLLDYVIGVDAPLALCIKRAMLRDNITKEQIIARMEKQMPNTQKMAKCHFVIRNNETEPLLAQIITIHNYLSNLPNTIY